MRSLPIQGSWAFPAVAALAVGAGAISATLLTSPGPAGTVTQHETGHTVTALIGHPLNAELLSAQEQKQPAASGNFKTIVEVETETVGNGVLSGAAISCPKGYVATGGGGGIGLGSSGQPTGITGAYLTSTAPFNSGVGSTASGGTPTGWLSVVTNDSGATQTQSAWAVCTRS